MNEEFLEQLEKFRDALEDIAYPVWWDAVFDVILNGRNQNNDYWHDPMYWEGPNDEYFSGKEHELSNKADSYEYYLGIQAAAILTQYERRPKK